jgi:hypothetical protein
MGLQRLAALIESDGVFQIDFALLQAGDDFLQLLESGFEGKLIDGRVVSL